MKKLFDDLTEEQVKGLTTKEVVEYSYDNFENELMYLKSSAEMFEKLGKDFRVDARNTWNLYNGLSQVHEWIKRFTSESNYTDEVKKVTSVIKLQAYVDPLFYRQHPELEYAYCSGLFTPVEVTIIPVELMQFNTKMSPADCNFIKQLIHRVKEMILDPTTMHPDLPSQEEVNYGTIRVLSCTHVAVVNREQTNPLAEYIRSNNNWKFIGGDGYGR